MTKKTTAIKEAAKEAKEALVEVVEAAVALVIPEDIPEVIVKAIPEGFVAVTRETTDGLVKKAHKEVTRETVIVNSGDNSRSAVEYSYYDGAEKPIAYVYTERGKGWMSSEYYARSS